MEYETLSSLPRISWQEYKHILYVWPLHNISAVFHSRGHLILMSQYVDSQLW